ncbi:hypothetical protein Nepgr_032906 [Nepenthes gracilis]|uniref:Uncharacterized protein n=1 Tax=Nepenthes gracilis TaxID=150966 RepID=A0AAD3Y6G4_NEPGR|nr:hypothetical protein Nepgr_032906 [Nepenthes gracilis]
MLSGAKSREALQNSCRAEMISGVPAGLKLSGTPMGFKPSYSCILSFPNDFEGNTAHKILQNRFHRSFRRLDSEAETGKR